VDAALVDVVRQVRMIDELVGQISGNTVSQAQDLDQVVNSVRELETAVKSAANDARETADIVETLTAVTQQQNDSVRELVQISQAGAGR
jgi:methyl-accepting chemotaxis protein